MNSKFKLLAMALASSAGSSALSQATPLESQLRSEDERLLAAVHQGGRAEWSRVTTPDFIYIEEGGILPRAQFLAQLDPDGHRPLHIAKYSVTCSGDVALVVHHDDVPDPMTGALTPSQYVMTETWQLINDRWMLHIVHVDAVRASPPTIKLDPVLLESLVGNYRTGDRVLTIRHEGQHLVAKRDGEPSFILEPETRDVFFDRSSLRQRWIFQVDRLARATTLRSRDENRDGPVWEREKG